MANVAHASLTGSELHEPKGVATAALGTVYVADGTGTGSWQSIGASALTGMIVDVPWPVVQSGWLECDGSDVNTTTYSALYQTMSITRTGTRTNGAATITSLPSTSGYKAGYYVFGSGIASGTTIVSVDSGTQITLSANASSSGTGDVVVSPWLLNTNTIRLPSLSGSGYFRRTATSTTRIGTVQSDQNKAHTHTGSGTSSSDGAHTHTINITDPGHTHTQKGTAANYANGGTGMTRLNSVDSAIDTGVQSATTGITAASNTTGAHTHTYSFTSSSDGGTEARPIAVSFMTVIKT